MFMSSIGVFSTSQILYSSVSSHICTLHRDLARSRILEKCEVVTKVGSAATIIAIAIGTTSIRPSSRYYYLKRLFSSTNGLKNIVSMINTVFNTCARDGLNSKNCASQTRLCQGYNNQKVGERWGYELIRKRTLFDL